MTGSLVDVEDVLFSARESPDLVHDGKKLVPQKFGIMQISRIVRVAVERGIGPDQINEAIRTALCRFPIHNLPIIRPGDQRDRAVRSLTGDAVDAAWDIAFRI